MTYFYDLLDNCVTAYLDDVLIYSSNRKEHIEHVREVLKRLQNAGLQIDLAKSEFHTVRTKYLGLIILPRGLEMDPAKIETISKWEAPKTKRQLQRFLGFANFPGDLLKTFLNMQDLYTTSQRKMSPGTGKMSTSNLL